MKLASIAMLKGEKHPNRAGAFSVRVYRINEVWIPFNGIGIRSLRLKVTSPPHWHL
jgi:hypothetical protein